MAVGHLDHVPTMRDVRHMCAFVLVPSIPMVVWCFVRIRTIAKRGHGTIGLCFGGLKRGVKGTKINPRLIVVLIMETLPLPLIGIHMLQAKY